MTRDEMISTGKKQTAKKNDRIKIVVHSRGEHDDPYVDVGLQGEVFRIRKGYPAEVPPEVLEVLRNSVEGRVRKTFRDGEKVSEYVDVPRHTVEVLAG